MRKVWNTLVVLGILLCMIMSLGVTADAAEGDAAIYAVSDAQLAPESIDMMKTECPECLVVDVNGLADGQSSAGYDVVYVKSEPTDPVDFTAIWPGNAKIFDVGTQDRKVVLVGVDEATAAETVSGAVSAFAADTPYVIAVGPAAAAAVVAACPEVNMFLTVDLDDTAAAGTATVVNVGKQAETPVSLVKVNADGSANGEAIAVPQPAPAPADETAADGTTTDEPAADSGDGATMESPLQGADPVISAPETDAPYTVIYYAVKYDGNGKDENTFVQDDMQVEGGSAYTLKDNGYTRAGYHFVGWTLDVPDAEQTYQPGEQITVNANMTVYAKWEADAAPEAGDTPADDTTGDTGTTDPIANAAGLTVTYKPGAGFGTEQAFTYTDSDSKEITLPDGSAFTAPEGTQFSGWQLEATGEIKAAGESYTVTGDMAFIAQYTPVGENDPSTVDATTVNITYKSGVEGIEDQIVPQTANSTLALPECMFTYTEGQTFVGWMKMAEDGTVPAATEDNPPLAPGASVEVGTADMTFVAQLAANTAVKVTYQPGEGATGEPVTADVATTPYTLLDKVPETWTPPTGKTFGGWQIGETTYQLGQVVDNITADTTVTAVWTDATKATVDPAVTTDSLTYIKGSTDRLEVAFKAKIDTVSMDNAALALNTQYGIVEMDGVSTVSFQSSYLDGLAVGDHTLYITFVATDTTEYTPNTRVLTVKEAAKEEDQIKQDWDRGQNLVIDFASYNRGNPTKLEILRAYEKDANGNYKKDENGNYIPVWMEMTKDKDYSISGTKMTFYPSMLGSWTNQQYGFRVTFDGAGTGKGATTMLLYLNVTGTAPAQATAAPTGTPAHVTGDSVNLRSGAGTNFQVLRTVAKGTQITVYSVSNGWAYVSVDGVTGYMSANYIAYDNATPTPAPNGVSPATGDTNNVTLYIVILVVLIIALAAVLIIVIKRRKN